MLYCPNCRKGYQEADQECSICQESLVHDWYELPCPACGTQNRINRTYCWNCKADLSGSAEALGKGGTGRESADVRRAPESSSPAKVIERGHGNRGLSRLHRLVAAGFMIALGMALIWGGHQYDPKLKVPPGVRFFDVRRGDFVSPPVNWSELDAMVRGGRILIAQEEGAPEWHPHKPLPESPLLFLGGALAIAGILLTRQAAAEYYRASRRLGGASGGRGVER